jgi:DNA-binding Lrp family transcriptional regulator
MNPMDIMKAFVLLNTELGQESNIIEALEGVEEITQIYSLYGIYDLIIEMEADTMDKVKEVVFNKVRRLDNVKSTITLLTYGDPIINE